jgi:predicted RND superfamily exporter protein
LLQIIAWKKTLVLILKVRVTSLIKRPVTGLTSFLQALLETSLRKRKIFLSLLLPILVLAFYYSAKTGIAVRTEDFSDKDLVSFKNMEKLKEDFAFEDKLSLIVSSSKKLEAQDLCRIETWLYQEVENNKNILSSASLFDLRYPEYNDGKLFYPKLIKDACNNDVNFHELMKHPLLRMFSTKDLTDVVIHLEIAPLKTPMKHGIYDYEVVKDIIKRAKADLPFDVYSGGTLFFQNSVLEGIKFANVVNLIAVVLLISLYFYFYRSFLFAFIMILIVLVTNTFIKAGMTILGHKIDPLSSCIFLMITVAILEDYMLLSFMIFKKKLSIIDATHKLLLPSFLTSLTTAIGFGSLYVSRNPSIVHFSIWTAFGAMFEWVAMFLILPMVARQFPALQKKISEKPVPKSIVPKKLISYTLKKPFAVILAFIPYILLFIPREANLSISPYDLFTDDHEASKFRQYITQTRKAEGEISIVFDDQTIDESEYSEKFKKHPLVTDAYSEQTVFDSIRKDLPEELHTLVMEDFRRTPVGAFFATPTNKRIILTVKSYSSKDVPGIASYLEKICQDKCTLASEIMVTNDYSLGVLETLYESASTGFGMILILITCLVLMTDKKYFFPVIISSLWASFALLLFVVVFKIQVNIVTCVALSVLIGAAGDNAIQFLLFKEGKLQDSVSEIGEASSENLILMMSMAATLLFSYFATPRDLSFLLMLGICFMFIGDIWVLNGLADKED